MRLQLRIKVGNDVQSDWLIMLGKLFHTRYVKPYHVVTTSSVPETKLDTVEFVNGLKFNIANYVEIEIDGSQELTPEHWEYIKNEEYTLRFIEPLPVLADEEEG